MKNLQLEILKELGKIGNKEVVICRWSESDDWKVQTLYKLNSKDNGVYYKGVSSYNLTELNELFKMTKGLKQEDFEKMEKSGKKVAEPKKEKKGAKNGKNSKGDR